MERKVTKEELKKFCAERKLPYVESSMYDIANIRSLVLPVVKDVHNRKIPDRCEGLTLDEVTPVSKKCCLG